MKKISGRRGFTLMELIAVIAIVAVLAAILVPTFMNVISKARVTSVNHTASSIQKLMNQLLLQADSNYYGIVPGKVMTFNITVNAEGGRDVWKCSAATPGAYNNDNRSGLTWGTAATLTQGDEPANAKSGEAMICSMLSDQFVDMRRASIVVVLYQGDCRFVVFTNDTGDVLDESEYPLVTDGKPADSFVWDGKTAGISPSGMIIGTAPVVDRAI